MNFQIENVVTFIDFVRRNIINNVQSDLRGCLLVEVFTCVYYNLWKYKPIRCVFGQQLIAL